MNDLDFDELDKAIGDTGSGAPQADAAAPDLSATTDASSSDGGLGAPVAEPAPAVDAALGDDSPVTADAASDETAVAEDTSDSQPQPEVASQESTDASSDDPQVVKSQGKFMDMVHRSSDMTVERPTSVLPPSEVASRQAPDITPGDGGEAQAEPASDTTETSEEVGEDTPTTQAPTEDSPEAALAGSIGSIDFSEPAPEAQPDADGADSAADATPAEEVPSDQPADPLNSPFIPDAKVDKRPLGGDEASTDEVESTPIDAVAPVVPDTPAQSVYAPDGAPAVIAPVGGAPKKSNGSLMWIIIIAAIVIVGGGGGFLVYNLLLK